MKAKATGKAGKKASKAAKRSKSSTGDLSARRRDVKGGLQSAGPASPTQRWVVGTASPAQRWVVGNLSK